MVELVVQIIVVVFAIPKLGEIKFGKSCVPPTTTNSVLAGDNQRPTLSWPEIINSQGWRAGRTHDPGRSVRSRGPLFADPRAKLDLHRVGKCNAEVAITRAANRRTGTKHGPCGRGRDTLGPALAKSADHVGVFDELF
eukprot:7248529-Pyramimonas_sp.AAC.1